jgi:glycine/D-amino acid oxidase-like deaminating enzyme
VLGRLLQPRGGTARHDAVAWGYARAADALGVDIIQNCEVTGFRARTAR